MSRVEEVLFDIGLYYPFFAFLEFTDLCLLELVNHQFFKTIRCSEPTWRITAGYLFHNKLAVPKIVLRLLTVGNTVSLRKDLLAMSIRDLKLLARKYAVSITTCFEKTDIVSVLNQRETRKKHSVECLARFAVRYAYIDSTRNTITEEELCEPHWNIRVKESGRLSHLLPEDPWWNGTSQVTEGTTTTVHFLPDNSFGFRMSGPSPFASMLPDMTDENQNTNSSFQYALHNSGRSVQLSVGVSEIVFRHPVTWGFMMGSDSSVWSGFPLPSRGRDTCIEDPMVETLRQHPTDFGFAL